MIKEEKNIEVPIKKGLKEGSQLATKYLASTAGKQALDAEIGLFQNEWGESHNQKVAIKNNKENRAELITWYYMAVKSLNYYYAGLDKEEEEPEKLTVAKANWMGEMTDEEAEDVGRQVQNERECDDGDDEERHRPQEPVNKVFYGLGEFHVNYLRY